LRNRIATAVLLGVSVFLAVLGGLFSNVISADSADEAKLIVSLIVGTASLAASVGAAWVSGALLHRDKWSRRRNENDRGDQDG
jgi:hypothetical protein